MNWGSIGSGNGLSPVQRHAITWTNTGLLSIRLLRTISVKFESEFYQFHSRKCIWNCLPKGCQFFPGGDKLRHVLDQFSSGGGDLVVESSQHHYTSTTRQSATSMLTTEMKPFSKHLASQKNKSTLCSYSFIMPFLRVYISWPSGKGVTRCCFPSFCLMNILGSLPNASRPKTTLDSFTIPLHSASGRHLSAVRAMQGMVRGLWKTMEIPISHLSPQSTMTNVFPNLNLNQPITKG